MFRNSMRRFRPEPACCRVVDTTAVALPQLRSLMQRLLFLTSGLPSVMNSLPSLNQSLMPQLQSLMRRLLFLTSRLPS